MNKDNDLIQKMSFSDKIAITKEERYLTNFSKINKKWDSNIESLSKTLKRQPNESLLLKSDSYRLRKEKLEALDILKSEDERYGDFYWYMSLRKYDDVVKNEKKHIIRLKNKINQIGGDKRMEAILKYACDQQNSEKNINLNVETVLRLHDLPDGFKSDLIETKNKYFERIRKPISSIKRDEIPLLKKFSGYFDDENAINELEVELFSFF